jgi:RNA-directed DNA polymerase
VKRQGHLIEGIAAPENLRLAFFKACRGKRGKRAVLRYRDHLEVELKALGEELFAGEIEWGDYYSFEVADPKPRTIHAAPFKARVAQHAIINRCEPAFESYQIHDSYACRKGKGLDRALERAVGFSQPGDWFLQLDVRKFFDSIDHRALNHLLERRFKDRLVLRLLASIVDTFHVEPGKGVPIGNLTSQYFANHYLGLLDHFVKEELRVRRYTRYMDDFLLWSSSREQLRVFHRRIEDFLEEKLALAIKPPILGACSSGMTFLGYRVFPQGAQLARRTRDRFRRKGRRYVRRFERGEWDEAELARHMLPMLAFVRRGASRAFRQRAITECGLCPEARTA